jgi:streptogramin lyase
MPHDAVVGKDGLVWYSEFSQSYIGRLDPRTGDVKEWKIPVRKPDFPEGSLDIQLDREGNPWVGLLFQGGAAKLDRKTEKVTVYPVPPEHDGIKTRTGMVAISPTTGVVWSKASQDRLVHGFDPKKGKAIATHKIPPVGFYGMEPDSRGNLVLFGLSASVIGVMDPATGKVETYPTPTPNAAPRRGQLDAQDRAWFAEFYAGKIGMFDPKTKAIQEWDLQTPWGGTYDAVPDKNGEVWSGGMHTDYIFRLNPANGQVTKYLLPRLGVNIRRMDVDNSASPVAVWIGENHHAKLARLEVLE